MKYPVDAEKIQEMLKRKCKDQGLAAKKGSKNAFSRILNEHEVMSPATYNRMIKKKEATNATLERLAVFLNCGLADLLCQKPELVKQQKEMTSSLTKSLESADHQLRENISEILKRMVPSTKAEDILTDDVIVYKSCGEGNYRVWISFPSEWEKVLKETGYRNYEISVQPGENEEAEIIKGLQKKLQTIVRQKNMDEEEQQSERLIKNIETRKLIKLEKPTVYMEKLVDTCLKELKEKLDKQGYQAGRFQKDDVIQYYVLDDGVYDVILPLEQEYCEQLGLDFPLELEVALPTADMNDSENVEEALKDGIQDQFNEEYSDLMDDDDLREEFEEKMAELHELPLEKCTEPDMIELYPEMISDKTRLSYMALLYILYLREELDEMSRVLCDVSYARKKFGEFKIPVPDFMKQTT